MKSLHRVKALAAYDGAREVLKKGMTYPGYMLIKEAARGVLSYIAEDTLGIDISEKTKLERLLEFMHEETLSPEEIEAMQNLIEAEHHGLEYILAMDIEKLLECKKVVKRLTADVLHENK